MRSVGGRGAPICPELQALPMGAASGSGEPVGVPVCHEAGAGTDGRVTQHAENFGLSRGGWREDRGGAQGSRGSSPFLTGGSLCPDSSFRPALDTERKSRLLDSCLHSVLALPLLGTLEKHLCLFAEPPNIQVGAVGLGAAAGGGPHPDERALWSGPWARQHTATVLQRDAAHSPTFPGRLVSRQDSAGAGSPRRVSGAGQTDIPTAARAVPPPPAGGS